MKEIINTAIQINKTIIVLIENKNISDQEIINFILESNQNLEKLKLIK